MIDVEVSISANMDINQQHVHRCFLMHTSNARFPIKKSLKKCENTPAAGEIFLSV